MYYYCFRIQLLSYTNHEFSSNYDTLVWITLANKKFKFKSNSSNIKLLNTTVQRSIFSTRHYVYKLNKLLDKWILKKVKRFLGN